MIIAGLAGRRVVITGITGFIGRSVAEAWAAAGASIIGVACRGTRQPTNSSVPLHRVAPTSEEFAEAIRISKADVVLHAAGSASVAASLIDPEGDFEAGPKLLHTVLEGIRLSGLRPRLIFPSSAAVYGNPAQLPVAENARISPISPYGRHKAAAERLVLEYATAYDIPAIVFRIFSTFGPYQKRLLFRELFLKFMNEREVTLEGSGAEIRDFLHVDDFASIAALVALQAKEQFALYNAATGRGLSVRELAQSMRNLLRSEKPIVYANRARPGDPEQWIGDITAVSQFPGIPELLTNYDLEGRMAATLQAWVSATVNVS